MIRARGVAFVLVLGALACRREAAPGGHHDASSGAPQPARSAVTFDEDVGAPLGPAATASREERKRAVVALLEGRMDVGGLALVDTDADQALVPDQYDKLTRAVLATADASPRANVPTTISMRVTEVADADRAGVERLLKTSRESIERCYQDALAEVDHAAGSIELQVTRRRDFSNVSPKRSGSIPQSMVDCVMRHFRTANLGHMDKGMVMVAVRFEFRPK
jgi:hypothetical protein